MRFLEFAIVGLLAFSGSVYPQEEASVNRLSKEQSPYLLQHSRNPVDWFPFGEEAFEKAKRENKPILLSIGYSACHWCHVMERESFEDAEVARFLNQHFVSIKVDREERPDVDRIYMNACVRLQQGRGGWPLTAFLTPDRKPFFAGTYYPKADFLRLSARVQALWQEKPELLVADAARITALLDLTPSEAGEASALSSAVRRGVEHFLANEDLELGGFGGAPKFPRPSVLLMLLTCAGRTFDDEPAHAARRQLEAMMRGGIYDHLEGGFHRYSVDANWLVPHFEKMLYDQGLLVAAYASAHALTPSSDYARVMRETLDFCLGTLRTEDGAFIAALDADTEGVEGAAYTFTKAELERLLTAEELTAVVNWSAISAAGNWEHERNILHHARRGALAVASTGRDLRLDAALAKLRAARALRPQPRADIKVLTEWNAYVISGLALAGDTLGERRYVTAAIACADALDLRLRRKDGTYFRSFAQGVARHAGGLADHAALVNAFLDLHHATLDARWIHRATALAELVETRFRDPTGRLVDSLESDLVVKTRELYDGATPSGVSLFALACARLGQILGDEAWSGRARAVLASAATAYESAPWAYPHALMALARIEGPSARIEILGRRDDPKFEELVAGARRLRGLRQVVVLTNADGDARALVCEGKVCLAPAATVDELALRLAHIAPHATTTR